MDDRSPYAWRTNDYGVSWTKIVDGILPGDFVRVIREDPYRKGLLYAGTEHGVYVSFDDGVRWVDLSYNLPDTPVTGLTQIGAGVGASDAHLFEPTDATRGRFRPSSTIM